MKKLLTLMVILLLVINFDISYDIKAKDSKINDVMNFITKEKLEEYLKTIISFGPRVTGTGACKKTASYIYKEFATMGLKTSYHNWSNDAQNVEGILKGDELIIILNAHFDSVANTVGADDNAAGVAALLAIAEAMSRFGYRHTIKFVAFSGEEEGLLGSDEYVKEAYERGDKIIIEFNIDMIGHAESKDGERKFRIYATEDADWIVEKIEEINNATINFKLVKGNINRRYGGSDYYSFAKYGYESIAFFEYEWNPHMHEPADNLSNVNMNYLLNTTRLIAGIATFLGDADLEKPYLIISSPKRGKIYFNGKEWQLKNTLSIIFGKLLVKADANSSYGIKRVEFFIDNELIYIDNDAPYEYEIERFSIWLHKIKVIAYDKRGESSLDIMKMLWVDF